MFCRVSSRQLQSLIKIKDRRTFAVLSRSPSFRENSPELESQDLSFRENVLEHSSVRSPTIVITGAAGNLGRRIINRLVTTSAAQHSNESLSANSAPRFKLVLLDSVPKPDDLEVKSTKSADMEYIQCDLANYDPEWVKKFHSAFAVFAFAARNPSPDATSEDSYKTMCMSANTLEACSAGKVERVIFASSNHVVGGLLWAAGQIAPDAEPNYGTKYEVKGATMDSTYYAASKAATEAHAKAMVASGRLSRVVILRLGFCLPGENRESQISVTGHAKKQPDKFDHEHDNCEDEHRVLDWWKSMHLKTEDLDVLVDTCVSPGLDTNENRLIYVNAMSDHPKTRWILHENDLGFAPMPHSAKQSSVDEQPPSPPQTRGRNKDREGPGSSKKSQRRAAL